MKLVPSPKIPALALPSLLISALLHTSLIFFTSFNLGVTVDLIDCQQPLRLTKLLAIYLKENRLKFDNAVLRIQ